MMNDDDDNNGFDADVIAPRTEQQPRKGRTKRVKNKLLMCIFAVCLMWATSLKVAVYIVSFFIDVPPLDVIIDSCKSTYQITHQITRNFDDCIDVQVQQCHDDLDRAAFKETRRVNISAEKMERKVDSARNIQSDCSSAYSSLRYTIEAWVAAGHSVPYTSTVNNSNSNTSTTSATCTANDRSRLSSSVGDASAVRSEAFSVSTEYSTESQTTVQRLVEYAEQRAAYDAEYLNNHTKRVQDQLSAFVRGIDAPDLDLDGVFGDIQTDIDSLMSCVTPRAVESPAGGPCPSIRGAQERLSDIHNEMDRRIDVYKQELDLWRSKINEYKDNVKTAYRASEQFYWGVKNAVPEWLDDVAFNSDWWDIDADAIRPVDVTFPPVSTPTFSELPTLDDVWDSVSVTLELFYRQLDGAEAQAVLLSQELGDAFTQNITLSLPDVTPSDYNPPKYRGADNELSSLAEEERLHEEKSEEFIGRTALALDTFAELSQNDAFNNETALRQDEGFFFNFSSIENKLSSMDINFKSLVQPGLDFDLWFLRFNSFNEALFLFDLFYRVYSTVHVVYKYWSVGALKLPKVDMRARKESNVKNILRAPTVRLLMMIVINPAMGFFLFIMSVWWLATIAAALYTPLYEEYSMGCVPEMSNGTFISRNLFSLSFNHAYRDGSSKLLKGLEELDAERGQICSSRYAPSASRYQKDASLFSSLAETHEYTAQSMDLMKRCIEVDALEVAFQEVCCDIDGFVPCHSQILDHRSQVTMPISTTSGSTCPMNELLDPPAPFLPPTEHFNAPSCIIALNSSSFEDIDDDNDDDSPVFNCNALPYCDVTCEGPNQPKMERTTKECGCMVEWYLHALWLKIILSGLVYALTNASRIGFVDGLARLQWRRLHPDSFTVSTSCRGNGMLISKRIKCRGREQDITDTCARSYIKGEIDRNMVRFQAKGLGMVACAILANCIWIWVLYNLANTSTPTWLM